MFFGNFALQDFFGVRGEGENCHPLRLFLMVRPLVSKDPYHGVFLRKLGGLKRAKWLLAVGVIFT